jgi:transposase-like protein
MCHECDDEFEEEQFNMEDASPEMKEEFFDYITEQMGNVMKKAESMGLLHQLIMEWPKERIIQFELATVIEGRSLDEESWKE